MSEPTDVLFLIDGSGSVKPHNFDKLRVLLKNIVDSLYVGPDGANVALIQFSSRELTKVEFNLDTFDNKDDIKKAIDDMIYQRKYTYTGYAMEMAREKVSLHTSCITKIGCLARKIQVHCRKESLRGYNTYVIFTGDSRIFQPTLRCFEVR